MHGLQKITVTDIAAKIVIFQDFQRSVHKVREQENPEKAQFVAQEM